MSIRKETINMVEIVEKTVKIESIFDNYFSHLDEKDTQVVDLLTDLQHYCEMNGLSFGTMLRYAETQYLKEKI